MRANKGIGRAKARALRLEEEANTPAKEPYSSDFWVRNRERGGYLLTGLRKNNYRPLKTWEEQKQFLIEACNWDPEDLDFTGGKKLTPRRMKNLLREIRGEEKAHQKQMGNGLDGQ